VAGNVYAPRALGKIVHYYMGFIFLAEQLDSDAKYPGGDSAMAVADKMGGGFVRSEIYATVPTRDRARQKVLKS
jgi:hypothetical protein